MSALVEAAWEELVDVLERAAAALAEADAQQLGAGAAARLHRRLRAVRDRVGLAGSRLLAAVESDGGWQEQGARSFPEWVARTQGTSMREARAQTALGQAVTSDLPATAEALAEGAITLEHAQVIAQVTASSPARLEAARSGGAGRDEAALVEVARRSGVDRFRTAARRWGHAVDAEAAEREHAAAVAKEHLTFSRRADGVALSGFLTHEHGAALTTALRAVAGVPAAGDERSVDQRQAAALAGLARLVLDQGLAGSGQSVRPHIAVHVSWETLEAVLTDEERARITDGSQGSRKADGPAGSGGGVGGLGASAGPAELGGSDEPLPPSILRRLVCDSQVSRIVFGPAGEVLDVGRARRTYTGQQRRAVIARDRHCQYPRCTAPPMLGEVHHTTAWASGGRTSVSSGVLLCWFHHDLVHRRGVTITRVPGGWEFRRADGTLLADLSSDQARAG